MSRRGENIYKRKDGRWEARYVKEVMADGKKKYGSVYADSYKEVKAKQQQCLLHPNKNNCNSMNLTINVLIAEWLDSIKNQVKPNTYQKYESVCKNHIIVELGSVLVRLVSNYTIINFTDKLKDKNLSAKSINDILIVLGLAFKYADEEYEINTLKIRYIKEEKKDIRVLSVNEQLQLTTYLSNNVDIYKLGILLALYTGVRVGELCALQWEDITDSHIKIDKTMTRIKTENSKTEIKIGSPKSDSSKRLIPTPQCLLPLIHQFKSNGYVLSNNKLEYTEPRLMQIKFERMISECGLEKTNFHALRHTFATRCVEAGVDVKTLSEILGHSDVKTTLNRYVHSSFELKQKSMKQFELSFTIKPKATTLSSVTAGKKKFTVKWKKQTTQTTGYEIQYATDSKFTKNKKTVTVSKNSTTSKTISKLSAKKKYYVRIRTYKTVKINGKNTKIYSSWSKSKTVTTKK